MPLTVEETFSGPCGASSMVRGRWAGGSWGAWAFSCGVAWALQVHLDPAGEYASLELACGEAWQRMDQKEGVSCHRN